MAIDLNRVASFVSAVRHGSFSGAARELDVPRSTVSARVQALEESLGVRLLKRTTRRMSLTDEGRVYFDEVASAVAALESAGARTLGTAGALSGVIRITAPTEYPLEILSRAIASFREEHPRVRFDVRLTNQTLDFVGEGIDLAIRGGPARGAGLVSVRLPDVPFGLFASPTYLARRDRPKRVEDLEGHELLLLMGREQRRLLGLPQKLQTSRLRESSPVAADSMALLKHLVIEGTGIAVLPRHLCTAELASGVLIHLVPSFDGGPIAAVHLVFLSRRDIALRVRAFADHLKAVTGREDRKRHPVAAGRKRRGL